MLKGEKRKRTEDASVSPGAPKASKEEVVSRPAFEAALSGVLVDPPVFHAFAGGIDREMAGAIWTWIARDVAAGPVARLADGIESGAAPAAAFEAMLPEILEALKETLAQEADDYELERRNTIQMGGEDTRKRLPYVIMALRRHKLLEQAAIFGKAVSTLQDEAAIATALQSITINNPVTRALWMQAMISSSANPSRVMAAAVSLSGGGDEVRIANGAFAPLVEAMLSHAQSQIALLGTHPGVFADHDLACKAIDRFHRLMRAINYNLEIDRKSHWGVIIADLTGKVAERLNRPMREITANVTKALRKPREGADRVDPDNVLAALNAMYLLITVRNSRDSLALNALLEQAWSETGQAVEVLVTRALDMFRANPADPVLRERLDLGIKLAELRFNPEYAEILRRARDGAERRTAQQA
ncbi:hypothetical protein [Pelagibacterium xiamenense]|uniref:hypothetical protein n=1 Tax=Pelagibacterium xiamenense TaxID=2901140 RepID=UPI001E55C977|nr:hypothetical protein [Pelagibacterium xiamenense]MCD7059508.1 hypothetical protein [Pelagibacterium xiamenense]